MPLGRKGEKKTPDRVNGIKIKTPHPRRQIHTKNKEKEKADPLISAPTPPKALHMKRQRVEKKAKKETKKNPRKLKKARNTRTKHDTNNNKTHR